MLGRVLDRRHDVSHVARPDHAQRGDLIDAGVGGVQLSRQRIAVDVAVNDAS